MELTQKPFPLECEPFKITFVGRPLDPNKGFQSLLDALELLMSLPDVPIFNFWVIGGEPDEAKDIANLIKVRPNLQKLLETGMISVWGRVKREALPEFYKRSSILVMPSHREPFGLVAIESMLCGCPVIGTKQGGLSDTIIHGQTGVQVDLDSPKAITNAILLYIRDLRIRNSRSIFAREWAKFAFTKSKAYEKVRELYYQNTPIKSKSIKWDLQEDYIQNTLQDTIKSCEALLNSSIQIIEIINSRYHITAKIKSKDIYYVIKSFNDRPSLTEVVLPLGKKSDLPTSKGFVENSKFHAKASYMPKLLAYDIKKGVAIYEWLNGELVTDNIIVISELVDRIREFGQVFLEKEKVSNYANRISNFLSNPTVDNLNLVDEASLKLNSSINNHQYAERETHPVVGLYRILLCSEHKGWAIEEDVLYRIKMIIRLAINLYTPNPESIAFSHGGIKRKHIINSDGNIYALDTEHAGFSVGSLDIGTWMCSMALNGTNAIDLIKSVNGLKKSNDHSATAIQWFIYFLIVNYLIRVHHGEINEPTKKIKNILYNISLAL